MRRTLPLSLALLLLAPPAAAYPLDGEESGIRRLAGYLLQQAQPQGSKLPPGALLPTDAIRLHLEARPAWNLDPADRDAALQTALERVFRERDPSYGILVVDYSDPERPRWAGVRENRAQVPGSVGKVLCMAALFDGLRRAFPDPEQRMAVLRDHVVEATDWVISDSHKVPRVGPDGRLQFAIIQPGERFTLAEWLDHMVSASANSAGSIVWKEAMLLRAFGADYPPAPEREAAFFRDTPPAALRDLAQQVINDVLNAADLDPNGLRVGSFWTKTGKRKVPGVGGSRATPKELARFLLRIEQGRLVDAWSSLEMKRYLYMTKRRYRYAYPPELAKAAIYFKSGSLYRCAPEPDFKCGKYMGNAENAMNSIAIVESPAGMQDGQVRYLVALTSDVLRRNSAWDHARLGAAVEELVRRRAPVEVREAGSAGELKESGRSD